MDNKPLLYRKSHLAKWLLALSLVCSLFIFSGYTGHSPIQQQKAQTESVLTRSIGTGRSINYQQKLSNPVTGKLASSLCYTCNCIVYNRLINVKLIRLSLPLIPSAAFQFQHYLATPHSAGEDPHTLLTA